MCRTSPAVIESPTHTSDHTHPLVAIISRPNFVSSWLSGSLLCRSPSHCFLFDSALENPVICQMAVYSSNTSLLSGPVAGWHSVSRAIAKQVLLGWLPLLHIPASQGTEWWVRGLRDHRPHGCSFLGHVGIWGQLTFKQPLVPSRC